VLPSADAGESGQRSRAWELVRIAYEEHFALSRHYSSVMFQARIAITTVMVAAVALGFGFVPRADSNSIEFAGVPARGLVAYVAALLINLLHAMEVTYFVRFYRLVHSGREIERRYGAPAYFTGYVRADSWPLYFAYLGGILLLVALFLGAAWRPQQGVARSVALLVAGALPAAVFIRSYALLVRAGRTLFETSAP
jgi:hypothetical protein